MDTDSRRSSLSLSTALLAAAAIIGACFIVYGASVSNRFVNWDDTYLVFSNPLVKELSFGTIKKVFTSYDPELYIPLTFLSYQVDHFLAGLNPTMFHATSLLWHALSAVLVAYVGFLLSRKPWVGMIAGLLFAVHPLNVEAVAWISGRKDVLSTFFFLLSIAFYLLWRERAQKNLYVGSIVAFLLGLFAKVNILTLPIVLLLLDWREKRKITVSMLVEKLPYFALSFLFGVIALFGKKDVSTASTLWEKILMAGKSSVFYLEKLAWPSGLSVIYPYTHPVTITSPDFFVPVIAFAVLFLAIAFSLKRTREVAFAFAFFFLTLAPSFININKGGDLYFASDRYAYVPLIGLFFLAGIGIVKLYDLGKRERDLRMLATSSIIASCIVLALFSLAGIKQAGTWKNSETLFLQTLKYYPKALGARLNLAVVYRESERFEEAEEQLNKALLIKDHPRVRTNLASIYSRRGEKEKAKQQYEIAMRIAPNDPEPVLGMGLLAAEAGDTLKALEYYRRASAMDPHFIGVYSNIGAIYLEQGKLQEAEAEYRKALTYDPFFPDTYFNLAYVLTKQGKTDEAIAAYERTISLEPKAYDAYALLAQLYADTKRYDEAIASLRKALSIKPDNTEVQAQTLDILKQILRADEKHQPSLKLFQEFLEKGIIQRKGAD